MHNIIYENGVIEAELLQVVNIHKPFYSRVDKVPKKSSIKKLIISPDETRNSKQIKRFLVSSGNRYAYKMFAMYKNDIKCHSIYATNSAIDRILVTDVVHTLVNEVDRFPNLKDDIIKIINFVLGSWEFDCIISDIPWLENVFNVPTIPGNWNLKAYNSKEYSKGVDLLLNTFKAIPLNLLPYECFKALDKEQTDIPDIDYKCPLILMKSNVYYAGYLANCFNKGLPATLFRIAGY